MLPSMTTNDPAVVAYVVRMYRVRARLFATDGASSYTKRTGGGAEIPHCIAIHALGISLAAFILTYLLTYSISKTLDTNYPPPIRLMTGRGTDHVGTTLDSNARRTLDGTPAPPEARHTSYCVRHMMSKHAIVHCIDVPMPDAARV